MSLAVASEKIGFSRKQADLPECMDIKTRKQLIAYIETAIREDDGMRYSLSEVRQHLCEKYKVACAEIRGRV